MARAINAATLAHVKQSEAFRSEAYPDPGSKNGKPVTIGYGQTRIDGRPVRMGETITEAAASRWLKAELNRVGKVVESVVKVPINDNQFGALVSFTYNVGDSAFKKSTLLRKLNAGDYAAVPVELGRWIYNDGKVMQGLVNRRKAEADLFRTPVMAPDLKPVPPTPSKPKKRAAPLAFVIAAIGAALYAFAKMSGLF